MNYIGEEALTALANQHLRHTCSTISSRASIKSNVRSTKPIDFPKIRHKNVEYFNLVHAHKPKFGQLGVKGLTCGTASSGLIAQWMVK